MLMDCGLMTPSLGDSGLMRKFPISSILISVLLVVSVTKLFLWLRCRLINISSANGDGVRIVILNVTNEARIRALLYLDTPFRYTLKAAYRSQSHRLVFGKYNIRSQLPTTQNFCMLFVKNISPIFICHFLRSHLLRDFVSQNFTEISLN